MPGVPARVRGRKPEAAALERHTLGSRLKRRRIQLGLRQKDVAPQLGVGEHTLVDWERDQSAPYVSYYPAIIAFLGFEPWDEPETLGERLRAERYRRGWSIALSAARLGVDEGTFAGWESERRTPTRKSREAYQRFLSGS